MNAEFEQCSKKKKIKEFSRGKTLVKKEMQTAQSDMK